MNVRQVVPRDAIPSVEDPSFEASYPGEGTDLVVVIEDADPPRAYPLRYLNYHEIVNDSLPGEDGDADEPIAVTWCPLCGSAVVYDRSHGGRTLEFGVSGKLADDDLVMYDRTTGSEWKQSSGKCIAGEFEGETLSARPAPLVSWTEFRAAYPEGVVLSPPHGKSEAASADETPAPIEYDDAPYEEYFEREGFGLDAHRETGATREWPRSDDIAPKTVVLGVVTATGTLGFPLPRVREAGGVVQTTVGETPVLVVATPTEGLHGFEDPGYEFELTDDGVVADGTTWDPVTGRSSDGRRLERLSTRRLFAFAWQDDHGPESFYDTT